MRHGALERGGGGCRKTEGEGRKQFRAVHRLRRVHPSPLAAMCVSVVVAPPILGGRDLELPPLPSLLLNTLADQHLRKLRQNDTVTSMAVCPNPDLRTDLWVVMEQQRPRWSRPQCDLPATFASERTWPAALFRQWQGGANSSAIYRRQRHQEGQRSVRDQSGSSSMFGGSG